MSILTNKIKGTAIVLIALVRPELAPKVVFFHDIGRNWTQMGTPANVFWRHMKLLREGDIVCFDDGFRGIWDEREKLKVVSSKFKVIVFIAIALVGKPGYLTWDEIGELQANYGIEFQSHTWSHQTLVGPYNDEVPEPANGRSEEWYNHELVDSKSELERQLGKKVTALSFPVGYFSDDVIRRCKEAGYEKVYASYPGNVTDDYIQPRCIAQDLSPIAFRAALNGGMMIFEKRYKALHTFPSENIGPKFSLDNIRPILCASPQFPSPFPTENIGRTQILT